MGPRYNQNPKLIAVSPDYAKIFINNCLYIEISKYNDLETT